MRLLLVLLASFLVSSVLAAVSSEDQVAAVEGLIGRIVPDHMNLFVVSILTNESASSNEVWELESLSDGRVAVRGSSGVAAASAFQYYLKYFCNSVYLWQEEQVQISSPAPKVAPKIRKTAPLEYRYYYNVCTFGYSSAFWTWERWEREVDWMALNGINLPLAFTGQEYIWERVFASLGMEQTAVRQSWFSNAAFLPWNRMGNLNNWDGPLSEDFISARVLLQKQILNRQRSFGMRPILPGFAGHVPPIFPKAFPEANLTKLTWAPEFGSTYLLSPEDPLFHKIGTEFIRQQTAVYGTDHFYNADTFNEMDPVSNETAYLTSVSKAVFAAMDDADPKAVWILQGWFLLDGWWGPNQTKAFLDGSPDDRLIVLDLWAEVAPYWADHDRFYGKQFIWCMLHDFGGRSGLYAAFDAVNQGMAQAFAEAPNMIGTGLTPEAIETNPVIYDYMQEYSWDSFDGKPRNLTAWMQGWAARRYGQAVASSPVSKYWQTLLSQILNCSTGQMGATAPPLVMRPALFLPSGVGCCATLEQYYDPALLDAGWTTLLSASASLQSVDTYRNDLVEITRQVLGDYSFIVWQEMSTAFNKSDVTKFEASAKKLVELFADLDTMLASQPSYLLGQWVARAEHWGIDAAETQQMRRGALLQVTTWGPATEQNGLHEYAFKLWAGLVGDYYAGRWQLFIDTLRPLLSTPSALNMTDFNVHLFAFETDFIASSTQWSPVPSGESAVAISSRLRAKYNDIKWPATTTLAASKSTLNPTLVKKAGLDSV